MIKTRIHPRATLLAASLLLSGVAALVGIAAAKPNGSPIADPAAKPIRLDEATMIIEVNSTDRDAGLQVFLDGRPWTKMAIFGPKGRKVLDVDATGRLNRFGLTELFSESHEPEFSDLPLRKFKRRFPKGQYSFRGRTVSGRKLLGNARFSHATPAGPKLISPAAGGTVSKGDVVASWNRGPQPAEINIVGYRVIVEREEPLRVFSADLPASVTSITIPAEFLQRGVEYKLEVQAIAKNGNQTISERTFDVN